MRFVSPRLLCTSVAVTTLVAGVAVLGPAMPVGATTSVTVTTTADTVDGTTTSLAALLATPGADGKISLREALVASDGTPSSAGSLTTINVPTGTYQLTHGEIAFGSASNANVAIVGTGGVPVVQQTTSARIFENNPNVDASVAVAITNVSMQSGVGGSFGGGALLAGGPGNTVTLTNDTFSGNSAAAPNNGGAISFGGGGTLQISGTTFSGNTAAGAGGAIYVDDSNQPGAVSITNSTFTNNTATAAQGGAVSLSGSAAHYTIGDSTLSGNTAGNGQGGAVYVASGTSTSVTGNRIVNNIGTTSGVYAAGSVAVGAADDWWGCNAGPGGVGCDTKGGTGSIASDPRIVASIVAVPNSIGLPGGSTVTAGFTTDSSGTPLGATPPSLAGVAVSFTSVGGTVTPASGTTNAGGTAGTSFSATAVGNGSASATIDNQTVTAPITVNGPPTIRDNPVDRTVCVGAQASFTAAADGSPTPTVQWQVSTDGGANFTDVPGATSTTLQFAAAAGDDGNQYHAVFSNGGGDATTTAAKLTVNIAPLVTTNPTNAAVGDGDPASFTAAATGRPTPTVQWQVSTDNGANFNDLPAETNTTLSFTAAAAENGNQYRARFTNPCGIATTSAATLSVDSSPVVTTQPSDQKVCLGNEVSFSASATGSDSVQWQVSTNGGADFNDVAGATAATLTFTPDAGDDGNQYRAVFTNSNGPTPSDAATLTVDRAASVTLNPLDQHVTSSATVSFTAAATGKPAPTVQWEVSDDGGATFHNIAGATATTLSFTAFAGDNGHRFRAVFTNACGSATTTAALLTVDSAPGVITNPSPQTVCSGSPVTFSASASGTPTPTAQWQVSTNGGASYGNVAGATSPTLSFTPTVAENGDRYRVVFTNGAGSATTTGALLTVNSAAVVTTNPVDQSAPVGTNVSFVAAASGSPAPTVQWQLSTNGGTTFNNIAGATSPTLSFTASSAQDGGLYRAVFTNGCGSATTTAATLHVGVITLSPTTLAPVFVGEKLNITITATGGRSPYTFKVTSGALPKGVSLSSSGVISKKALRAGTWVFTITATDQDHHTGSQSYSWVTSYAQHCTGKDQNRCHDSHHPHTPHNL